MEILFVYVPKITNRLRYIFQLLLEAQLGIAYKLTTDQALFQAYEGPKFSYGDKPLQQELFFKSVGLLFEREISSQELKAFVFKDVKAIFPVYHKQSAFPFDPFAASFYLVSRYEEYLPFVRDRHGRFEATSSCLHAMQMLQKPVINIWAHHLEMLLKQHFSGLPSKRQSYQFIPTYDIDAAWSYLHKGLYRSIGAYARDLLAGDFEEINARTKVLLRKVPDPFDTYALQLSLQKEYKLRPIYFILFASYSQYDKNISRRNPSFRELIRHLADYATIGIHPGYASFEDKNLLKQEIQALSEVLHEEIQHSRQHFLRMNLPETYHRLLDFDITDDYTMGYASQPGFRAGIANSFYFYDLDHDVATKLRINPVILMDGTLRDYMDMELEQAKALTKQLILETKKANGTFISLWHNETLSDAKRWKGWNSLYIELIQNAIP